MDATLLALLFFASVPSLAEPARSAEAPAEAAYTVECTFHNPAYSGPCTVTEEVDGKLAPKAACTQILGCLNDSRCLKTYCNATTVRGGWTLEKFARREPGAPGGQRAGLLE